MTSKKLKDELDMAVAVSMCMYHHVVSSGKKRQSTEEDDDIEQLRLAEERMKNRRRPGIRANRRLFDHQRAYTCIQEDFLLEEAALFGGTFEVYFRLSRPRVKLIFEALGNSGDPYYSATITNIPADCRMWNPSFEAKVLLPIKTLAYGVACHCFCDYFQMSTTTARNACRKFHSVMTTVYKEEYLRLPTAEDLKSVTKLHQMAHGVEGMLGSLDCMHTYWKNCPVAWQQSFQGKEKCSTIVLEAVADHYLWFWHASYGYGGSLNDINILQLSPLMKRLTNGSFSSTEEASGVTPFNFGSFGEFDKTFMLVDGIYPQWCRFMRGVKEPLTVPESRYTTWQEGARKDVERAFGVLQCRWKAVAAPLHFLDPKYIGKMVSCCIILHNMGVSDRVMGDVKKRYDPGSVPFKEREVTAPHDVDLDVVELPPVVEVTAQQEEVAILDSNRQRLRGPAALVAASVPDGRPTTAALIGIGNMPPEFQMALTREKETATLQHKGEWQGCTKLSSSTSTASIQILLQSTQTTKNTGTLIQ